MKVQSNGKIKLPGFRSHDEQDLRFPDRQLVMIDSFYVDKAAILSNFPE